MKKIVTDGRYEEKGSPMFWVWLLIGAMWLVQAVLRMADGEDGWLMVSSWVCVACSMLCALAWSRYQLIADEKGVSVQQGWSKISLAWDEIERVTIHNKASFWKSTGLTFQPADPGKRRLYINRMELLPLVKRYAACPIEEDA